MVYGPEGRRLWGTSNAIRDRGLETGGGYIVGDHKEWDKMVTMMGISLDERVVKVTGETSVGRTLEARMYGRFVAPAFGEVTSLREDREPANSQSPLIHAAHRVLKEHAGLARTRDFEDAGIGRWHLSDLIAAGVIERVRHGLYRAMDLPATSDMDLVQACTCVPRGVRESSPHQGFLRCLSALESAHIRWSSPAGSYSGDFPAQGNPD